MIYPKKIVLTSQSLLLLLKQYSLYSVISKRKIWRNMNEKSIDDNGQPPDLGITYYTTKLVEEQMETIKEDEFE